MQANVYHITATYRDRLDAQNPRALHVWGGPIIASTMSKAVERVENMLPSAWEVVNLMAVPVDR